MALVAQQKVSEFLGSIIEDIFNSRELCSEREVRAEKLDVIYEMYGDINNS